MHKDAELIERVAKALAETYFEDTRDASWDDMPEHSTVIISRSDWRKQAERVCYPPEPELVGVVDIAAAPSRQVTREESRSRGYTGNSCNVCGSMQMQIAGHCEVCAACGETTGCS